MNNLYDVLIKEIVKACPIDSLAELCELNQNCRELTDKYITSNLLTSTKMILYNIRYLKLYHDPNSSIKFIANYYGKGTFFDHVVSAGNLKCIKFLKRKNYKIRLDIMDTAINNGSLKNIKWLRKHCCKIFKQGDWINLNNSVWYYYFTNKSGTQWKPNYIPYERMKAEIMPKPFQRIFKDIKWIKSKKGPYEFNYVCPWTRDGIKNIDC